MKTLLLSCLLAGAAMAAEPGKLFEEAERLSRANQKSEAMAKAEEAVAEVERAHAAGEKVSWQAMNGFRFAARLAREDFLDFKKAFVFCDKLFELANTDYWRVPARLERAQTFRALGDFTRAQREYDAIAAADERQRAGAILPQAEMVYFDMGEKERGRTLLVQALMNQKINGRERFSTLRKCAQEAITGGRRQEAFEWYAMLDQLPFHKPEERARFLSQAWFEMGRIEESRGRTAMAKTLYRKTMDLKEGDMRYRVRARDAIESIEYFE